MSEIRDAATQIGRGKRKMKTNTCPKLGQDGSGRFNRFVMKEFDHFT